MSRRELIRLTDEEALAFLEEQRVLTLATNGRDGWPHTMPLWYVVRDLRLWGWTYAKSQKARNLARDARATVQVETGEQYHELRGLVLKVDVVLHRDPAVVERIAMDLVDRYNGTGPETEPVRDLFRRQVPKRVGLELVERSRVSWDHRKLGATY